METCNLVFVYGTLMSGYGNNRLLRNHEATFVGEDKTEDVFVLGDVGFPYAVTKEGLEASGYTFNEDLLKPVIGEVWEIPNDDCLSSLDRLEGVPHHYQRNLTSMQSGKTVWMYQQEDPSVLFHCSKCHEEEGAWKWLHTY